MEAQSIWWQICYSRRIKQSNRNWNNKYKGVVAKALTEIKTDLWNNYIKHSRRYQAYPGYPGNNYVRDCIRAQFDEWYDNKKGGVLVIDSCSEKETADMQQDDGICL